MEDLNKIEWQMQEYEHKEKNNDWFWALGLIVVAGAITSIIFKNYFFAILIVISGVLIFLFSIKPPEIVNYEINNRGLKIKDRVFLYSTIKSFWVQKENPATLFIKLNRVIMPIMSMPIDISLADKIRGKLLVNGIEQEEMKVHFSEKIMDAIGF